MDESIVLEVKNLSVEFENNLVLDNLNFSVRKGEVLAIVGPNGAGKSVLFRSLLNLIPYSGDIDWIPNIKIGYVPQKLSIEKNFPLTVREFLHMKIENKGKDPEAEILRALESVGLKNDKDNSFHLEHHILEKQIGFLSGGELQRILIAWSLIGNPDVILFDEPTSGIDAGGEETIYELLKRLQESNTLTILLISHDLNIVYKYTDDVLCLNRKMLAIGKPHVVLSHENLGNIFGKNTEVYHHEHDFHQ
jgi:zinc transport system ATP-binding protein